MKKLYLMSIVLLLAAMMTGITPVLAEYPNGGPKQQQNKEHREKGDDENGGRRNHDRRERDDNHHKQQAEGKKHKKHHNDGAVIAAGILLAALNVAEQRSQTRDSIKRTADILIQVQSIARANGGCIGLGKALAFQEKARFQLKKGRYEKAISNTLWARAIALHILDDPEEDFIDCDFRECELVYSYLTDKESEYMEGSPSPIEMQDHIKGIDISDQAALNFAIATDI